MVSGGGGGGGDGGGGGGGTTSGIANCAARSVDRSRRASGRTRARRVVLRRCVVALPSRAVDRCTCAHGRATGSSAPAAPRGRSARRARANGATQLPAPTGCGRRPSERARVAHGEGAASGMSTLRMALLLAGGAAAGLAALCDSRTWHPQHLWGASRDFWQAQWDKVVWALGDDPLTYWVYGTTSLTFAVYWTVGGLYTLMDLTGRPRALRRYKIQPGANEPPSRRELARVLAQVLFNQLAVGLPLARLAWPLMRWRGPPALRPLPSLHACLAQLAFHVLCEEVGFYYSHRLLHWRGLYARIHKLHHQWTAPVAVTAIYCHPLEHVASNLLPPFLGVFLLGSHVATAWLWFCLAILSTLNAHCGYHLPLFPSPEAHDFHHRKFNQCFGVLGVLDRLHGTDSLFRRSAAYRRHVMLLSLLPARQLVPDDGPTEPHCAVANTIRRHSRSLSSCLLSQ